MSDVSLKNHNQAIQDLQTKLDEVHDKHDKQLAQIAKKQDAEINKRVAEAVATALT